MGTDKKSKEHLRALYSAHFGELTADQSSQSSPFAVYASAPGRIELAGNHTDHQGGCTISTAINARAYALAVPNGTMCIHVFMEGFGEARIALSDLEPHESERETPAALIRGMAAAYAAGGNQLTGFDMVTYSDIPVGRGLSSSAAFEVLVGAVLRAVDSPTALAEPEDLITLALEGAWTEQRYFGKPCGAQDQLASVCGGIDLLDFSSERPTATPLETELRSAPYTLFLIDSRCDHSLYTDEFAAIPADMRAAAAFFGCTRLEDVSVPLFLEQLTDARAKLGDRVVLRALHYFEETKRVKAQAHALQANDFDTFLQNMRFSGASSAQYLQNISPRADGTGASQPVMVILALCAQLLDGGLLMDTPQRLDDSLSEDNRLQSHDVSLENKTQRHSAYRIVGGGFGGSVLAFVPNELAGAFEASMNAALGYDACSSYEIGAPGVYVERVGL